jgi:hypothetical protein
MKPEVRAKAAHLLQYITDESAIIAHIKRDFGYQMDATELRRIKSVLPKQRSQMLRKVASPIAEPRVVKRAPDQLLAALADYHATRNPDQAAHWGIVKQRALGVNYGARG